MEMFSLLFSFIVVMLCVFEPPHYTLRLSIGGFLKAFRQGSHNDDFWYYEDGLSDDKLLGVTGVEDI
jgi:hypothetical protein